MSKWGTLFEVPKTPCKCTRTYITELSSYDTDDTETTSNCGTYTIDEEEFPFIPTYRPLRSEPQEIRLLSLGPKHGEVEIEVSLRTYRLNRCPKYVALSYTWGDNKKLRPITVDGYPFEIRETLVDLLQSLPVEVATLPLWLDVLCINQRDIAERNNQVAVMSNIFLQAYAVYCWVGAATPNIASAHKFLEAAPPAPSKSFLRTKQHYWGSERQKYLTNAIVDCEIGALDWMDGLHELCIRKYWTRVWVLQETILAKRLFILAGHYIFTFDDIRTASVALISPIRYAYDGLASQAREAILSINLGRDFYGSLQGDDYFRFIRQNMCRDPRDLVFALRGVLPKFGALRADYSKTTTQVWWQACVALCPNDLLHSIRLWEAMRPTDTLATVDATTAFSGTMSVNIYPWQCADQTARYSRLYGTLARLDLEAPRTVCPKHCIYLAPLDTRRAMELKYFEDFEQEPEDVLFTCARIANYLWCAILRLNPGGSARFVGCGNEATINTDRNRSLFENTRVALHVELVAASEIKLHLGDDWKESQSPSEDIITDEGKIITPGILQLNGPAAILLHQIKALTRPNDS